MRDPEGHFFASCELVDSTATVEWGIEDWLGVIVRVVKAEVESVTVKALVSNGGVNCGGGFRLKPLLMKKGSLGKLLIPIMLTFGSSPSLL